MNASFMNAKNMSAGNMSDRAMIGQPKVYVVDDDQQACKAVLTLVQTMGMPAESFSSAEAFLAAYDGHRPACLVTDVRMLGMSGLELQEQLIELGISISVVVLTAFASTPTTVRAMRNGALTLMEKPCDDDLLWEAIRTGIAADAQNCQHEKRQEAVQQRLDSLTSKEREVLEYIVAGDANKVIAGKLDVSVRTVENHRQKIFHKMKADSLAELVRLAMTAGVIADVRNH
jgi:FixJ family two-component response regulator